EVPGGRVSRQIPCYLRCSAFSIFLSVLYCPRAYTAHKAAGSQPIRVICRMRQTMPATGLPIVKKVSQGNRRAISNRMAVLSMGKEKIAILTRTGRFHLQDGNHVKYLVGVFAGVLRCRGSSRSHRHLHPAEHGRAAGG